MQSLARCGLAIWLALAGTTVMAEMPEAELMFNGALAHLRAGRATLAIKEFKRAIDKDAKNPYFQKGLGQAYLVLGDYGEAIKAFRRALDLNPAYADARNDLGTALLLAGERDEGKKHLEQAFTDPMNPTPALTAQNLGRAYIDEGNLEQSIQWYRTSVERDKRYPESHLGLAAALTAASRVDEAISVLQRAVIAVSDDTRITAALGEALYRAGRFDDARPRLQKAVEQDPNGESGKRAAELLKHLPKR